MAEQQDYAKTMSEKEKVDKKKRHRPAAIKSVMGAFGYKKDGEKNSSDSVPTQAWTEEHGEENQKAGAQLLETKVKSHSSSPITSSPIAELPMPGLVDDQGEVTKVEPDPTKVVMERDCQPLEYGDDHSAIGKVRSQTGPEQISPILHKENISLDKKTFATGHDAKNDENDPSSPELVCSRSQVTELMCSLEEIKMERDSLKGTNKLLNEQNQDLMRTNQEKVENMQAESLEHEIHKLQKELEFAKALKQEIEKDRDHWMKFKSEREEELQQKVTFLTRAQTEAETIKNLVKNENDALTSKLEQLDKELANARKLKERNEPLNAKLEASEIKIREAADLLQVAEKKLLHEKQKKEEQLLDFNQKYTQARKEFNELEERHQRYQEDFLKKEAEMERTTQQFGENMKQLRAKSDEELAEEKEQYRLLLQEKDDQIDQLQTQLISHNQPETNPENGPSSLSSQSNDGAGASSLPEENEHVLRLTQESAEKDQTIADLQRQLHLNTAKKDEELLKITDSYQDLKQTTAKMSKGFTERDKEVKRQQKLIAELKQENERLKHEVHRLNSVKMATTGVVQAIKLTVDSTRKELEGKEEKNRELQTRLKQLEVEFSAASRELDSTREGLEEKEEKIRELQTRLKQLEVEFMAAKGELSHKDQMVSEADSKIRELEKTIGELGEKLAKEQHGLVQSQEDLAAMKQQVESSARVKQEEIITLKTDLEVARSQAAIFEEDLKKTLADWKYAKTESERILQVIAGLKEEKKSLEEIRRSYEQIKDNQKHWDEEKKGSEQQVRAYKRQVDSLNDTVREMKQKVELLQDQLDKSTTLQREKNALQSQCHELQRKLLEKSSISSREIERLQAEKAKEIEKIKNESVILQQIQHAEIEKLKNANMILQQRLRSAWDDNAQLQKEASYLKLRLQEGQRPAHSQQVVTSARSNLDHARAQSQFKPEQITSKEAYRQETPVYGITKTPCTADNVSQSRVLADKTSKQADVALKELEIAKQQLEAKRRTQHLIDVHNPTNMGVHQECRKEKPQAEERAGDIGENVLIYGIDGEIQQYADNVRDQTRPPPTQEFLDDDATSLDIPYDPNLECQGCGKRFRVGEIQKLRRHVNEFCIARNYTENQQKY